MALYSHWRPLAGKWALLVLAIGSLLYAHSDCVAAPQAAFSPRELAAVRLNIIDILNRGSRPPASCAATAGRAVVLL